MTSTVRLLRTVTSLGAVSALVLATGPAAYAAPQQDELSEDTYGGLSLGEGEGIFPVDTEFDLMLASENFDIPETVEIWALSAEGDDILIGSGETESDTYQNPGSPTYPEQEVELIEVLLSSDDFEGSDWYAFTAVDGTSGEIITWTPYPVMVEGDDREFDGSEAEELWPVPSNGENSDPSSQAPTLESLTEETYGLISIFEDEPTIPLDQEFTVELQAEAAEADLWLLPPGGEEAVFLPAELLTDGTGASAESPRWNTLVASEDVDYSGIYGLVATDEEDNVLGWTPFALSLDGESLEPGDPGVHESEAGYSDRNIWPIPDDVPGPEEGQTSEEDSEEDNDDDATEEATSEPEGSEGEDPAETDATAEGEGDGNGLNGWVVVLAIVGGALIAAGIAYLVGLRRATED